MRVFNCTKHSCRSLGALLKTCKKLGVVAEFFLLKALKGVLHQWWKLSLTELVFRWNFYADIQLITGSFGYNYGRLKSSASHASRENTLLRCRKIPKWLRRLQRRFVDGGRTEVISTAFSSTACRRPPAGGKANRLLGVANSYSNGRQIVNNVFVR